jgi:hypothetical protein
MKLTFTLLLLSTLTYSGTKSTKVVYGEDNRRDLFEVSNPKILELAKSTAAMVDLNLLKKNGDFFEIWRNITLEEGLNICPSERFSDQPLAANCSGFLVKDDILVTAGHCYSGHMTNGCKTHAWVFDFAMENSNKINMNEIAKDNVYRCKKVLKVTFNQNEDFAVIQLDRKVTGRKPLKYRKQGKVSDKSNLLVIGHPSMLPTKVSPGGTVINNEAEYQFTTTLDTFQGNSGSAVFDLKTGMIEGILVNGKTDYIPARPNDPNSCLVVNHCDMKGQNCDGKDNGSIHVPGEGVTRITTLTQYIP